MANKVDARFNPELLQVIFNIDGNLAIPRSSEPDELNVELRPRAEDRKRKGDEKVLAFSPVQSTGCPSNERFC